MADADLFALFPRLSIWLDPVPRSAPANMAVDEALLRSGPPDPILRFYRWRAPAFSFGYFQRWESIAGFLAAGTEVVRRWTGGGLVDHRRDATYSLVIPASQSVGSPSQSYYEIHARLAGALQEHGVHCDLAPVELEPPHATGRCFAGGQARHDVLSSGTKIAGAAQRRHRLGTLHQGSVAMTALPDSFPGRFAALLATEVFPMCPEEELEIQAADLVTRRYGTPEWLSRR